jgi:hypothetical protein
MLRDFILWHEHDVRVARCRAVMFQGAHIPSAAVLEISAALGNLYQVSVVLWCFLLSTTSLCTATGKRHKFDLPKL